MNRLRKRKRINYYEPDEPAFDEYIYCEHCYDFVYEYCSFHGPLLVVPDKKVTSMEGIPPWVPRAALTTPREFVHIAPSVIPGAGLGVFSTLSLPRGVRFGPYQGNLMDDVTSMYCWQIRTKTKLIVVDALNGETSNWMRYVNCARNFREQNLVAFQYKGQIYYRTVKVIPKFTELLVFYGSEFAHTLGIDLRNYNKPQAFQTGKYIVEDISRNQREEVLTIDRNYKTETLVISEVTTFGYEENKDNFKKIEEVIGNPTQFTNTTTNDNNLNTTIKNERILCDICNTSLKNKKSFKEHMRRYRHKEDLHGLLKFNLERHRKGNIFQTDFGICRDPSQITVTSGYNLDITINNERFICDICNKHFKTKSIIRRHMYIHKKDLDSCIQCDFKTNMMHSLKVYMDKHRTDKSFEINFGVNTPEPNDFSQMKTTKNERLECDICNKSYKIKSSLTRHRNDHHQNKEARYI